MEAKNPFLDFHKKFRWDSVAFVRAFLNAEPDEHQEKILLAYDRGERRIAIRSGHGVGKTTTLAWIIIHSLLTKYPFKGVATAPTEDQLYDALASEVRMWIEKLPNELKTQLIVNAESVELRGAKDASFFSFRTARAEKPEALQGIHSENVLIVIDEAPGVPEPIFEAGLGSMSGEAAITIMAGNPTRSNGYFFKAFHQNQDMWYKVHISCVNHHRVAKDFVDNLRATYGENSNAFRTRVLGEFPTSDDNTIIPREMVDAAVFRDIAPQPISTGRVWGVDCARFGDDTSVIVKRHGQRVTEVVRFNKLDTMQLAAAVMADYQRTPAEERPQEIIVDSIGIGAGVVDRLVQLRCPVRGLNVSEAAISPNYMNARAELWYKMRDWFAKRSCSIPNDVGLKDDLCSPQFKFSPNGKLQVESKADMKKRGLSSPDAADALMLTFATDTVTMMSGSENYFEWNAPIRRNLRSVI